MKPCLSLLFVLAAIALPAQPNVGNDDPGLKEIIDARATEIEAEVIQWRRYFHENPELSNREFETATRISEILRSFGLEVQTGIAKTGVVAILKGGRPGPVVGLRADIDALPVRERVDIPFASTKTTTFLGEEVGVMHACGHDTHIAMLLGAAKILVELRDQIPGTVKFIFQPAEEGAPPGEEGGAALMVKEGVLSDPDVEAIFGLHISSYQPVGTLRYKQGGLLAAADRFTIRVRGKQTHGSSPWSGVDPIVTSAQIIMGLQTIISRQTELTNEAAVISVGKIKGGVRNNIIPEEVEMIGTIRTLDTRMQDEIHEKIEKTAILIAESAGATAEVEIERGVPVTYNDPELTHRMAPTINTVAGDENVIISKAITGAEDFSFYAIEVPGLFIFVGGLPNGQDPSTAAPHHTPDFFIDESGMILGVRTLCHLTIDYQQGN